MRWFPFLALLALSAAALSDAFIHDLTIKDDRRAQFFIEQFAFAPGGVIEIEVLNFHVDGVPVTKQSGSQVGFVVKKALSDSREFPDNSQCADLFAQEGDFPLPVDSIDVKKTFEIPANGAGFYNTWFVSCKEAKPFETVSFELKLTQYNLDPFTGVRNYLPAGQSGLPTMLMMFALFYAGWTIVWVTRFISPNRQNVNRMHWLITILFVLKTLSIFSNAMDKHFMKIDGSAHGWAVLYYIFASLKTMGLFLLIALIGTGFTFVKPFLSDRDKKIFLVVIPLQVIDNIAMIVLEETAPGSSEWAAWKDMFRLIDIICCGAVLIPIIWSIKHLREAAQGSGKARQSLAKLKLFRQFYLLVVSYIYFTRIIIYLLEATLPYHQTWLAQAAYESATLAFLVTIGYKFRPASDNPYFELKQLDSDDEAVQAELHAIEIESDDEGALHHPIDDDQDLPKEAKSRAD